VANKECQELEYRNGDLLVKIACIERKDKDEIYCLGMEVVVAKEIQQVYNLN
jgi:hypothetical protein